MDQWEEENIERWEEERKAVWLDGQTDRQMEMRTGRH